MNIPEHAPTPVDDGDFPRKLLASAVRDECRTFARALARLALADPQLAARAAESGDFLLDGHRFTVGLDVTPGRVNVCCRPRHGPPGQDAMERMLHFALAHDGEGVDVGIDPDSGEAAARMVVDLQWIAGSEAEVASAVASRLIAVCRQIVEEQEAV